MMKRRRPRFHPPEVWALVKAEYLLGVTAPELEERFGVRQDALRRRARIGKWTRTQVWGAAAEEWAGDEQADASALPPQPSSGEAAGPAHAAEALDPSSRHLVYPSAARVAELALARAIDALGKGDATLAAALIKAGNAVGEFAEFVAELRDRTRGGPVERF